MRFALWALMLCLVLSTESAAGELGWGSISWSSDWNSTDCSRPSKPSFYVYDVDSYNRAVREYNSYVAQADAYLSCVQNEAESDLVTFRQILENSLSNISSDVSGEVQRAKSDLEFHRLMLQ